MDFRLYDGALGRFFGIDLLADLFTSHSPYHFAYNNPVSFMDPTGLHIDPAEPTQQSGTTDWGTDWEFEEGGDGLPVLVIDVNRKYWRPSREDSPGAYTMNVMVISHEYGGSRGGGGGGSGNGNSRGASNGVLEGVQTALDVIGLVPGLGEVADGINAIIYTVNGDYVNASLSLAAMIPIGGQLATAGKLGMKAMDVAKTGNVIKKTSSKVDYLFKNRSDAMNWGRNQLGHNTQRMYDSSGKWIGWNGSNGSIYWGHGDWGKGVGSSTFPHLNYNIGGQKGHLFLGDKINNRGMWDSFSNYYGF